jgi:hypothetical protein
VSDDSSDDDGERGVIDEGHNYDYGYGCDHRREHDGRPRGMEGGVEEDWRESWDGLGQKAGLWTSTIDAEEACSRTELGGAEFIDQEAFSHAVRSAPPPKSKQIPSIHRPPPPTADLTPPLARWPVVLRVLPDALLTEKENDKGVLVDLYIPRHCAATSESNCGAVKVQVNVPSLGTHLNHPSALHESLYCVFC